MEPSERRRISSSFETHRYAMLLRMRSETLMVRSAKRVSNHEARHAATSRRHRYTLQWT